MNIPALTVRRPVLTIMVTLIVVTIGLMSLLRLPIDLLPDITYPTLTVSTEYGNAAPEEMEQLVTRPIEEAVSAVPGVEEITSTSSEGASSVRISFGWGTNLDEATNDVRDRLDRIIGSLPDDAERPRVRKFDTAATPILLIGVAAELDPIEMRQIIDDRIRPRLERVRGVAAVDVWGGLEREIRVEVDPDRLRALGLELDGVRQALMQANVNLPAGDIRQGRYDVRIRTPGEFDSLQTLENTVVSWRDGQPLALHQLADVRDTHQRITRIIRINDEPGVRLAVRKQSDANTVQVADAVNSELRRLRGDYPQLNLITAVDNARFIERSINNVSRSLLYGGALALLVLLFFLRSVRTTLVAATAIPVSVVATFGLIHFGGFTLNLMTLGGLALGVGLMVDNAIVVIENITRRRQELQEGRDDSAVRGTNEVGPAIVASTLTTLAIFLPMFFAQELAGVLFQQLAFVVAFALLCSLLLALSLVPMLMAHSRRGGPSRSLRPVRALANGCGAVVSGLERAYLAALRASLANRTLTLGFAALLFVAAIGLLPKLGTEFMPATDEGEVRVTLEMEPGTRLELIDRQMRRVEAIIAEQVPEMENHVVSVGASTFRASSPARADVRMSLVPVAERSRSSEQVANDLRGALADIPGATVRVRASQGMVMRRLGGDDGDSLEIEVRGFDLGVLDRIARQVGDRLEEIAGVTDVRLAREDGVPQQLLRIDRERAADLGLNIEQVARTVETALGGRRAGDYRDGGTEHRIWLQLRDADRLELDDILDLALRGQNDEAVGLRNLVTFDEEEGPIQIFRKEQQRVNTVSANIAGRDLGSVVADVRAGLEDLMLPRNVDITFAGDYEEQEAAFSELGLNLLLAVALVYMVLASLYESLRDPIIVMGSVPLAAIGVVLMLMATGTTLNTQSIIGCIMLVGIVVNNAILLVDQSARLHRSEGRRVAEAVIEAGRRRLRPILMTSMTTILALTPLALGMGEGGDAQAPMARAVVGGLLSASLITLFVIPVLYTLFHRDRGEVAA